MLFPDKNQKYFNLIIYGSFWWSLLFTNQAFKQVCPQFQEETFECLDDKDS